MVDAHPSGNITNQMTGRFCWNWSWIMP